LESDIPPNHPSRTEGAYPSFFKFASHTISLAKEGKLPLWSSQWEKDTLDELAVAYEPYSHVIDVKLLNAIGENMIDIVTGEKEAIEVGMEDNMLTQFYEQSIGIQEHTAYLARLLKQIGHRYPHMNILEVGAGTGGITKAIFQEIGHKLSSYTYTDISAGFFETAQQVFGNYLDRMLFKVLDISKDPRSQGYAEHSYDMVVASMVLHATPVLEETLRNARRLLKPGGFLVVLELQVDNLARMGTIFGAFPGWWLGADEGRVLSPCINLAEWEEVLRDTGFSGCDTATPVRNALVMPPTVFVSQAIDDHIEFLRDPLSSSLELFEPDSTAEDLILLGGGSLQTSRLIGQLKSLLRQYWGRNIKTVRSLVEFSALDISSNTTVLSLAELDTPVFKELKDVDWEALKKLLQEARTVLWVSRGRRAENPYANMMVGLLRSAKKELPTLDIQLFDFEGMQPLEARVLAEGLLQLKATTLWQRRDGQESLLATVEPEVIREESGLLVIPRLVASQERNDRYNSLRRPILVKAGPNTENVGIATSGDGFCIIHEPIPEGESSKRIRVAHSLLSAVQAAEFGCMFIVFGHNCDTGDQIVALSTKNTSLVCPMDELLVSVNVPAGSEAEFVSLVSHHMLASSALEGLSEGDTIVVHEPETTFAAVLAKEAKSRGVEFSFTTANPTPSNLICCLQTVSPSSPDRAIRALLPKNTSAFLDFSEEKGPGSIRERIHALLPAHCRRQSSNTLFSTTSWIPKASYINEIRTRLEDAVSHTLVDLEGPSRHTETVALSALSHIESIRELSPQTVVDWASISDVSIQVRPITESHAKFSDTKTYWLAGLSGGLGLSLCEWMVRHGAKYVVISSRRPNVEESWLEQMRSAGAVINVFAWYVVFYL
jgi:hybrid polyketide synthase/nonribosomal peptide synthetase ACE1